MDDIEIQHGSRNVYADLGFPDAEGMLVRSRLIMQLNDAIKAREWSREQAAAVVGLSTSALSRVLRGQFRAYQVDEVACWLNKAKTAEK